MAATTTSLSKALAVVLLTLACSAHAKPLVICPSVNADGTKTGALADADVYQGPPENKASMMPDLETSVWELRGYQQNSEERGESLYLVCRYAGIKATVSIEVPREATFCKIEGVKHGIAAFCGVNSTGPQNKLAKRG
ncbi:MAG: STY0301 family protein [Telluria sp.]